MSVPHCDVAVLKAECRELASTILDEAVADMAAEARADQEIVLAILEAEGGTVERCPGGHILFRPEYATAISGRGESYEVDLGKHVDNWRAAHRMCGSAAVVRRGGGWVREAAG